VARCSDSLLESHKKPGLCRVFYFCCGKNLASLRDAEGGMMINYLEAN